MDKYNSIDIKDFIHLYLGCDILLEDGAIDKLKAIDSEISYVNLGWGNTKEMDKIRLLLRPLSDMTEEEGIIYRSFPTNTKEHRAKEVLWFLSKHFDLFGLIEAGLAIDKTKLNSDNNEVKSKNNEQ